MTEQNTNAQICRSGHRQPVSGSKFCIYCGTSLSEDSSQTNQNAANQQNQSNQQNSNAAQNQNVNQQTGNAPNQHFQPQTNVPPAQNNPQPQYPAQQYQQQQQNYQQPPQIQAIECYTCGGNGQGLDPKVVICKECRWLKPLIPGYRIDSTAFEWAADAKAMATLRSMTPLRIAAEKVSEKVGRRWIESTFNGILLGEKQMPQIYAQAVKAARIIGMTNMPDVYLSGERPWECLTFGTEKDSFVVIGSAMAGNFQGADMLFLLAREMGHCQAGHALWKSVIRFLIGEQSQAKGFMAGGIMNAIKSPGQMIVNAVEVPLLAWARQAEITADRAALLVIGNEEIARRVLISWSLKSSFLFRHINIEAWLEQQAANEDDSYSKLSELTTSSTPYLSRRLHLLEDFAQSDELKYWRNVIVNAIRRSAPPKTAQQQKELPKEAKESRKSSDFIGVICSVCKTPMRVPLKALENKKELPVKCPNKECGKITRLKKSVKPNPPKPKRQEENMNYGD